MSEFVALQAALACAATDSRAIPRLASALSDMWARPVGTTIESSVSIILTTWCSKGFSATARHTNSTRPSRRRIRLESVQRVALWRKDVDALYEGCCLSRRTAALLSALAWSIHRQTQRAAIPLRPPKPLCVAAPIGVVVDGLAATRTQLRHWKASTNLTHCCTWQSFCAELLSGYVYTDGSPP